MDKEKNDRGALRTAAGADFQSAHEQLFPHIFETGSL
jgi:hypothetical protein